MAPTFAGTPCEPLLSHEAIGGGEIALALSLALAASLVGGTLGPEPAHSNHWVCWRQNCVRLKYQLCNCVRSVRTCGQKLSVICDQTRLLK